MRRVPCLRAAGRKRRRRTQHACPFTGVELVQGREAEVCKQFAQLGFQPRTTVIVGDALPGRYIRIILAQIQFSERFWETQHGMNGWGGCADWLTVVHGTMFQEGPEGILECFILEPQSTELWR